jgi:hypothetical protein
VQLQTNYGKTRWCANTHGAVSWHMCNHDHRENACVRWRMFEQNHGGETFGWTEWSDWWETGGTFTAGCV